MLPANAPDFSLRAIFCSPILLDPVRMRAKLLTMCVSFSSLGVPGPGSSRQYASHSPNVLFRAVPPTNLPCKVASEQAVRHHLVFLHESPKPGGQKLGVERHEAKEAKEAWKVVRKLHRYLIDQSTSTSVPLLSSALDAWSQNQHGLQELTGSLDDR
jgi:hypothetical protein